MRCPVKPGMTSGNQAVAGHDGITAFSVIPDLIGDLNLYVSVAGHDEW